KRTLFLDFASSVGKGATGLDYKTHEIVFVADSNGVLVHGVVAPKPYVFDHTEWVYNVTPRTEGGAAVATLTNSDGAHPKIALIDLKDDAVVELVEGEDLWHPAFWSNSADNKAYDGLDIDSAGVYCTPDCGQDPMLLRYKLELLWTYKDTVNTVMLGSSRMLEGIIPALLSDEFVAINMANIPNMPYTSKYLFENYVIPHVKNLKYVLVSLDLDLWCYSEASDYNFFRNEYKRYPGFVYDENHSFWKGAYPEGLAEMTQASYGSEFFAKYFRDEMGYVRQDGVSWEENPTVDYDSTWLSIHPNTYYESLGRIREIIQLAAEHDVYVLGVVFPQSPNFRNTGSFGKFGLRRSEAPALLAQIAAMRDTFPNFAFLDENKMGDHDYTDNMAINKDHLGYAGAVQMTGRIDSVLRTLK
ncbi:MAG: TIGR02171 family protein, partial [Fibrobacter sp.]|nr:TIGR02171 family protein [Fibrobacter sp.]